jgi:hypothetical protein
MRPVCVAVLLPLVPTAVHQVAEAHDTASKFNAEPCGDGAIYHVGVPAPAPTGTRTSPAASTTMSLSSVARDSGT